MALCIGKVAVSAPRPLSPARSALCNESDVSETSSGSSEDAVDVPWNARTTSAPPDSDSARQKAPVYQKFGRVWLISTSASPPYNAKGDPFSFKPEHRPSTPRRGGGKALIVSMPGLDQVQTARLGASLKHSLRPPLNASDFAGPGPNPSRPKAHPAT